MILKNLGKPYIFTLFLVFSITVLLGRLAFAEEIPEASSIEVSRLNDLIEEALNNNQLLEAEKFAALSREAQIGPAGAYADPMLRLEAMSYPIDTLSPDQFDMTGNKVSLTQAIPFPGKQSKLRKAATFEAQSEKERWSNLRLEVTRDVKLAFYRYFLGTKKKRVLEDKRNVIRQLIDATRDKYIIGKVPQAEVLNLQVEDANLIEQILIADSQIAEEIGDLHHLLGRRSHERPLGEPEAIRKTVLDFATLSPHQITERALEKNPSIRSKDYRLDATSSRLSYAKWNYLPDFEVGVGYTFREGTQNSSGVDFISGMVGISLPVWAITKQSKEVDAARAQKAEAGALAEQERIHLAHLVHNLYAELKAADGRVQLFESGVLPLTRQAVLVGKSAYLARKFEYSSLLTAINNRFNAEFSYYEALVSYQSKIAELEALTGESLGNQKP